MGSSHTARALKDLGAEDRQVTGRWENNRAENSHQPFRRRGAGDAALPAHAQLAEVHAAVHSSVFNHFNSDRSLSSRKFFKLNPSRRSCRVAGALRELRGERTCPT